jgi:hypothetical protein
MQRQRAAERGENRGLAWLGHPPTKRELLEIGEDLDPVEPKR